MDKDLAIALITAVSPLMLAGIGFFIRAYFKHIEHQINQNAQAAALRDGELKGQITAIQTDLRSNTIETVKTSAELKALWKWVDAKPRATDLNGPA